MVDLKHAVLKRRTQGFRVIWHPRATYALCHLSIEASRYGAKRAYDASTLRHLAPVQETQINSDMVRRRPP